ncbi:MAG: helix-hairpin-helix domain-containing protein [Acidobacteria bacterium]|nr:helix-hairpin-helix domain-containing protein [Acidobacteriota bacterium]
MSRPTVRCFCLAVLLFALASLAAEEKKPGAPVNINTATVEELAKLPGVGKSIAQRIVNHREKSGKFRTVEELLVIRGISRKKLEQLRSLITTEAEEAGEAKEAEEKAKKD